MKLQLSSVQYVYKRHRMHKILVVELYFLLDVSDYTSGCCVAIATQQPDVWYRHTGIYQMRCTAYKVAPDDGLI